MPGRVAAVLLLLLSLSFDSFGQCEYTLRYRGQFRSTVYDVAVDGNYLWTATGYGVQLLQITSSGPEVVDAFPLPGATRNIAVAPGGSIAYAGSGSEVFVLRRNGNEIEFIRDVAAPDVINDLLAGNALFVATRNGVAHYHLFDLTNPTRSTATLSTSRPNVTDLELAGSTLYTADGDGSVEIFNVSVPTLVQRTGALESALRAAAVHVADSLVYVSDDVGHNTEIFGGPVSIARIPYGSLSFATTAASAIFVAGSDRALRAIDLTNPARPAELFEQQLAPTGGTSNGIFELARSGNRLYVAAGDSGLLTYDISTMSAPYPMLAYAEGPTTSALIIEGSVPRAYFSSGGGSIFETSLQLAVSRTANPGGAPILHDSRGSDLLFSDGKNVSLFAMTPPATFQGAFRAAVTQAAMLGTDTIIALLADQTVWTLKTTAGSTPERVDTGGALISFLARNGTTYALGEVKENGTTVIHLPPNKFTIEGAATGGLAINATHAAFFTFRGINLVDLTTGVVSVLPDSTSLLPKQLQFAGTDLLVLGESTLMVWDTANRTLKREHILPASAARMHAAAGRAAIATDEGMLIVEYLDQLPGVVAEPELNRYYTKAVTGRDRLYLFSTDGVDVYETTLGFAPHLLSSVHEPGLVDLAATPEFLYTLGGDGTVSAYARSGVRVAQAVISEGNDTQVQSMATAGNAVWVTISTGCFSGSCQKRTIVLDPRTLSVTASLEGGVTDVTAVGTRAYAILDLPREIASFDITNPLQPVMTGHIPVPTGAASIAFANDRVLVLGDVLYKYTPALAAAGDNFAPETLTQQQIRVAGNCAIVIGRADSPELYNASSFASFSQIWVPSNALSIAPAGDGRVYVLTEHAIDVWEINAGVPLPGRRRSVR